MGNFVYYNCLCISNIDITPFNDNFEASRDIQQGLFIEKLAHKWPCNSLVMVVAYNKRPSGIQQSK